MAASGLSTISSRTSASSSTFDRAPGVGARALGWIRLTHPFPSILDGLVSGAIAVLAGGAADQVVRIGLAMTALQLGIGTVNDIVDAPRDAGRKAGKPIPSGLVSSAGAKLLAIGFFLAGSVLAASVSVATGLLAPVIIAIGLAYDLRLKGTAWSWLPFAIGIPILPVFGWIGVAGSLPAAFVVLVPAAVAAGAALAIGNTLVDVERDRDAGISSIALRLGPARARRVGIALYGLIWVAAVGSAVTAGGGSAAVAAVTLTGSIPVVAAIGAGSVSESESGSGSVSPGRRERAWQAEAIGLGALAAIWLATVLGSRPGAG
jgi:4-hydroxybenzoate polyprenyltransferase